MMTGKPSDWPDVKTEIVLAIYPYIMQTGTTLFHLAGSGDHNHIEDETLQKHSVEKKMWPTQLRSIRSPQWIRQPEAAWWCVCDFV